MKKICKAVACLYLVVLCINTTWLESSFAATNIFINEIHYDNSAIDSGEFIEIAGPAGTVITDYSLVLYNGSGGNVYSTTMLNGIIPDQQLGYGTIAINYATIGIQNGAPDGIALINAGNSVVQFISYEGSFTAVDGPAGGMLSTDIGVTESGATPVGNSLQLAGTGASYEDFTWSSQSANTLGNINRNQSFMGGGVQLSLIHDIQGESISSPIVGNEVLIEGVVVGDFRTSSKLGGFFVQEEDIDFDGSILTSEGIFVYVGNSIIEDVDIGDLVRVKGMVAEFYSLTRLENVTVTVVGSGDTQPVAVTLPVSSLIQWEQYEGMLINISQTLYVTDNYNQGRYGEIDLSIEERLNIPTNIVSPGAPALTLQDLNDRSRIQVDDGSNIQFPLPVPYFDTDNTLRVGDSLPAIEGVLSFNYGSYEIHPTESVSFTRVNQRPTLPDEVGNALKVTSFNVLNYFTTLNDGSDTCGPLLNLPCRGADTPEEFSRQRDKIIAAITTMAPDLLGIVEIENDPADDALIDLVEGLNSIVGVGVYDYVNTGIIGSDAIKVALIFKPEKITPCGPFAILDSSVDPLFLDSKNRPSLAQTFEQNDNGGKFTIAVNHFKSKGSTCDNVGDPDLGDGQGNCNQTRTLAASALVNWLQTDPTGSEDPDYLIIGDLNSYAMEDPISVIKGMGYTDLLKNNIGIDAYSYVFSGQSGYLDHALANNELISQVVGVTVWHINADEPSALQYNNHNQPDLYVPDVYRSSDHDPVMIGLQLTAHPGASLENAITTLQVITGVSTTSTPLVIDADSDSKIGLIEALHILRELGDY